MRNTRRCKPQAAQQHTRPAISIRAIFVAQPFRNCSRWSSDRLATDGVSVVGWDKAGFLDSLWPLVAHHIAGTLQTHRPWSPGARANCRRPESSLIRKLGVKPLRSGGPEPKVISSGRLYAPILESRMHTMPYRTFRD